MRSRMSGVTASDLFRRCLEAGLREEGRELAAEFLDAEGADVLGVEPDGFGVEGVFLGKVDDGVGAVDVFQREGFTNLVERHELAVVFGRPAEEAEEVDEGVAGGSRRRGRW